MTVSQETGQTGDLTPIPSGVTGGETSCLPPLFPPRPYSTQVWIGPSWPVLFLERFSSLRQVSPLQIRCMPQHMIPATPPAFPAT